MKRNDSRLSIGLALLLSTAISGCGGRGPAEPPPTVAAVEPARIALSVAGRSNAAASVAALGQTVAAVWTAATDDTSDIYLSVSTNGGVAFGAPVRVNDIAGDVRASGEQAARVAVGHGGAIHVVWPAKRDGRSVILYAGSKDGGRTFAPAVSVAAATLTGVRGWHSVALGYDGGVHAVWLDGRNAAPTAPAPAHAHGSKPPPARKGPGPRQDIFHASWKGDGPRTERSIAAAVCFCCKTAVATSGDRVYAAWRHIYPGSLRDIAVARSTDNGVTFGDPMRVSEDGWKIDACPDDGPSMVADGHGGIHLAWPTLVAGDTPRKGIFYTTLSGDAFAPRLRLDSGESDPAHPQIASDEHTKTAIVWDERAGGSRRVVFRHVSGGVAEPPLVFASAGASYPVVAGGEGYWIVLWSAEGAGDHTIIEGRRIPSN
jgi:predicted small lipoprotein YifL